MRFFGAIGVISTLVIMGARGNAAADDSGVQERIMKLISDSKSIEVYSLDPEQEGAESDSNKPFHSWHVLGRITIDDEKLRNQIGGLVAESLSDDKEKQKLCFLPRHGIRFHLRDGKVVDAVMCFECSVVTFDVDARRVGTLALIKSDAKKVLNDEFKRRGIPLAREAKK